MFKGCKNSSWCQRDGSCKEIIIWRFQWHNALARLLRIGRIGTWCGQSVDARDILAFFIILNVFVRYFNGCVHWINNTGYSVLDVRCWILPTYYYRKNASIVLAFFLGLGCACTLSKYFCLSSNSFYTSWHSVARLLLLEYFTVVSPWYCIFGYVISIMYPSDPWHRWLCIFNVERCPFIITIIIIIHVYTY